MDEWDAPEWLNRYRAFKSLCAAVSGEYIRFSLTTGCGDVSYTHSQRTEGLPNYSCRLEARDGAVLMLELDNWRGRPDDVRRVVRKWLGEHSNLRGCKPAQTHYGGDEYWRTQLQHANQ
ncbi:hypothetical protein [Brevibacterium sp.]|uniref:hypothetical protein n=1 Tax=Brevibacterium sp. TaxID=1701 RepID=UPI002811EDF4|nr:hypothetical protein [Brevibacterium sp.]